MTDARRVRGLRGATTVDRDDATLILGATREMLEALMTRNALALDDVVSAIFTVTPDLRATFPARAAREMGWDRVPLLCAVELDVTGSLPRCIRVLLHAETTLSGRELRSVYLHGARTLRPDIS
jgi:chorismate mutase